MITPEEQTILDKFTSSSSEENTEEKITNENTVQENKDEIEEANTESKEETEVKSEKQEEENNNVQKENNTIVVDGIEVTEEDIRRLTQKELREKSDVELAVEQWDLTAEDLAMIRDVKAGSKSALKAFAKKYKTELEDLDLETEEQYNPSVTIQKETKIDRIATEILADDNWKQGYQNMIRYAPEDFMEELSVDPDIFERVAKLGKTEIGQSVFKKAHSRTVIKSGDFKQNLFDVISETVEKNKKETMNEKKRHIEKLKEQVSIPNTVSNRITTRKKLEDMTPEELSEHEQSIISKYKEY